MVDSTVSLSWEWILGIFITFIIIFLGWVLKQIDDLKKNVEPRIINLEKNDLVKTNQIETLNKIVLKPFEEKENKK